MEKKANGRPSVYSKELAETILFKLCEGESLSQITGEVGMPHFSTIHRWVFDDRDGFRDRYASARKIQAAYYAEQILTESIAAMSVAHGAPGTGEASAKVAAKKLHIDALKWHASKLDSSQWGHKTQTELSGPDGGAIKTENSRVMTEEDEKAVREIANARQAILDKQGK